MGQKAATSTTRLAHELLRNMQCSGGSRSFAKEMRALNMRSIVANHRKFTTTNWEPSAKLIYLTTAQEVAEELNVDCSMVVWLLKQIEMVKNLNKWVPQADWRSKKSSFECCLLLFYAIMSHFSVGFWHAMKSGFCMTTSDYQLSV